MTLAEAANLADGWDEPDSRAPRPRVIADALAYGIKPDALVSVCPDGTIVVYGRTDDGLC